MWTIGHSTRPIEEFLALLRAHDIQQLVDVRTIPRSRHNPQFNAETLRESLLKASLSYVHAPELGGLRKPLPDSINLGWNNTSFRGYADYMQTGEFWKGLQKLMGYAEKTSTAIMCAEAVPWRCHRSLIADALVSRNWTVYHILTKGEPRPHTMISFARLHAGKVIYPIR